jgi:hypothetical protein
MNEAIHKILVYLIGLAVVAVFYQSFIRHPEYAEQHYASKGMVTGMNDSVVKRVAALEALAVDVHKACATLEAMDKRLERIEDKLP